MADNFERLETQPKSGNEAFHLDGENLDINLLSFWRWSASDIVSNATRGVLAEFIVAKAMGNVSNWVRNEWDAYDLETDDGIKIEVKSAAYAQSWRQNKLSSISFLVQKKFGANQRADGAIRSADVYVFALLAHQDKQTIDPLNLKQWEFYALPTEILNQRQRSQHSITLNSLKKLCGKAIGFFEIKAAVNEAYQRKETGKIKTSDGGDESRQADTH